MSCHLFGFCSLNILSLISGDSSGESNRNEFDERTNSETQSDEQNINGNEDDEKLEEMNNVTPMNDKNENQIKNNEKKNEINQEQDGVISSDGENGDIEMMENDAFPDITNGKNISLDRHA